MGQVAGEGPAWCFSLDRPDLIKKLQVRRSRSERFQVGSREKATRGFWSTGPFREGIGLAS